MPGGSCHFWYLPVWKIGKLQNFLFYNDCQGESKMLANQVWQLKTEGKNQGRDLSLKWKIARQARSTQNPDSVIYAHMSQWRSSWQFKLRANGQETRP